MKKYFAPLVLVGFTQLACGAPAQQAPPATPETMEEPSLETIEEDEED